MQLEALRVFLKIAEVGSMTRAGKQLGMSKSRVSRSAAELEAELGARLLHRSTRLVRLTPDGEALVPRARRIVQEADEVDALFRTGRRLRGRVRIDLPVKLARRVVLPRLPAFLERHPELELFVSTTDHIVDVVREGFDCVLRIGELSDSELVQKKLGELSMVNCVGQSYAQRRGVPRTLDDLEHHDLVHYASTLGFEAPVFEYVLNGETFTRPMRAPLTVNTTDAYTSACMAGLGIIQVPRLGIEAAIEKGTAVDILPAFRCAPMPVTLLHPHGRRLPLRVRAVMDWIADALRPHLDAKSHAILQDPDSGVI